MAVLAGLLMMVPAVMVPPRVGAEVLDAMAIPGGSGTEVVEASGSEPLGYVSLPSGCRAVDTRAAGGPVAGGVSRAFSIRGTGSFVDQGGPANGCAVPGGAQAVEVTITAVSPTVSNGYLRAYPTGSTPTATMLNYVVGRGVTNTGTVPLGDVGDLSITNYAGTIQVVIDVQGYFVAGGGSRYVPLPGPCRVVDTRSGTGALVDGATRYWHVGGTGPSFSGQGGRSNGCAVPAGVRAAEVSVSVIGPVGAGFIRVAPNDGTKAATAFVNYAAGSSVTNTGTVTLSGSGADVAVENLGGTAHVAVDVLGYFTDDLSGALYRTVTPCRAVDTRSGGGPSGPGAVRLLQIGGGRGEFTGQGGTAVGCAVPQQSRAVEISVTAAGPVGTGFSQLGPAGSSQVATMVNYDGVGGVTNTGTVPLAPGGVRDLRLHNHGGRSSYLVDVLGYWEGAGDGGVSESTSSGQRFGCTVRSGSVWCWGENSIGQLGNGTVTSSSAPVQVAGVVGAEMVVAGQYHACALLGNGTVRCWGSRVHGQVGNGAGFGGQLTSAAVAGVGDAVQLSAGASHTCALRSNGTIVCWGSNWAGQLGDGTTTNRLVPTLVSGINTAVSVTSGWDHTCAVLSDTSARCWGSNLNMQTGDGNFLLRGDRLRAVVVKDIVNVVSLTAGRWHTCASFGDATMRCWGNNNAGQVGDGSYVNWWYPYLVPNMSSVVSISAGEEHTCASLGDATMRCWGNNDAGQVGDGTYEPRRTAVQVAGMSGSTSAAAGQSGSCTVDHLGAIWCWGSSGTRVGLGLDSVAVPTMLQWS
jgi:alpha-tubulin suppressor-like RCC1 family protein